MTRMPGYLTDCRFFEDSDQTTLLHWYAVPKDRPCLPVASFVEDMDWENLNGPRSMMEKGNVPAIIGEQWGPRNATRLPHRGWEVFTGHYCGTRQQWAGDMRTDRPEDIGSYGCCSPGMRVVELCSCSKAVATIRTGPGFHALGCDCSRAFATSADHVQQTAIVLSGTVIRLTETTSATFACFGCDCSRSLATSSPSGVYAARGCDCSVEVATARSTGTYYAVGCGCSTPKITSYTSGGVYAAEGCDCSVAEFTWTHSVPHGLNCSFDQTGTTALNWLVTVAGFTGDCAILNGTWTLTQEAPFACFWAVLIGSGFIELSRTSLGYAVNCQGTTNHSQYGPNGYASGLRGDQTQTITRSIPSSCGGAPLTLTFTPV